MNSLHTLLREKHTLFERLSTPRLWGPILLQLIVVGLLGLGGFGAAMGAFTQSWSWPLLLSGKIILLFWGTFALCIPSLFVFSALRGSRITLSQLLYLLIGSLATSGIVLGALLPISWFFSWTDATHYGAVVRIIHVFALVIALFFGLHYLNQGLQAFHEEQQKTHPSHHPATDIVMLWCILVLIVGVQMAQKIGPWYEEDRTRICMGSTFDAACFPRNVYGSPSAGIHIEDGVLRWAPGNTTLSADETHTLEYGKIGSHNWEGTNTAVCALITQRVECSIPLESLNLDSNGTYVFQASGSRDQLNQEYRTSSVFYSVAQQAAYSR